MAQVPFVHGGAEILTNNLKKVLVKAGHEVEIVAIPFKWYPPEKILENMLACQLLDLSEVNGMKVDLAIGLKFPAYLIPCENKVFWLIHQHRTAYDLWDHPLGDIKNSPYGLAVKEAICLADKNAIGASKKIFTISQNVSHRLMHYCGIKSAALYHPPQNDGSFYCGEYGDYFFFPSRICRIKRQHLALEALKYTKQPVKIVFAGMPDCPSYLEELKTQVAELQLNRQVTWLGSITEEEKYKLYADSLGVIFVPIDEDYGYITLESMLSSKPVITLTDSGGPLEFISNEETGLVAANNPQALAAALDRLWLSRAEAKQFGANAKKRFHELNITWDNVLKSLLQ
jgi:glycosyltransferase involved in cell wall biosynthesis